jgi:hypothetical protein
MIVITKIEGIDIERNDARLRTMKNPYPVMQWPQDPDAEIKYQDMEYTEEVLYGKKYRMADGKNFVIACRDQIAEPFGLLCDVQDGLRERLHQAKNDLVYETNNTRRVQALLRKELDRRWWPKVKTLLFDGWW